MTNAAPERLQNRRIVTGLDAQGRSTIIFDGPAPLQLPSPHPGSIYAEMWETSSAPASNAGNEDATAPRARGDDLPMFHPGGSRLFLVRYPGTRELAEKGIVDHGSQLHTSHAVDYVIILKGHGLVMNLETGATPLSPGDIIIFRGVSHDIHNYGEDEAMLVSVMIDAIPLETGTCSDR